MRITIEQMKKLHSIQLDMFIELKRVMDHLGIRYYFSHGSLLGAISVHDFIDEDDDIDIAIFRKDYDRLIIDGNKVISSRYFIQSCANDDFPLAFAKVRDKATAFVQPILEKCGCNKGIYIDIFPIDYVPEKESQIEKLKRKLLNARINNKLNYKKSLKFKILFLVSIVCFPSYKNAIKKRERLYSSYPKSEYVSVFGGKAAENRMMAKWFGEGKKTKFCDIEINCPDDSKAYLSRIYGKDYENYNPAKERITSDKKVEIGTSFVDFGDGTIIIE